MEYIEDCDDGEDSLDYDDLMPCFRGREDKMEDDYEDNDNVLIHRQDPGDAGDREQGDSPDSSRTEDDRKSVKKDVLNCKKPSKFLDDDCEKNPNFAIIVDFLDKFGEHLGIKPMSISELNKNILNTEESKIHQDFILIMTSLLKRIKLPKKMLITKRSWEKGLLQFCKKLKWMKEEAEELEANGWLNLDVDIKLLILKALMEYQFDIPDFKIVSDTLPGEMLRHLPAGRDVTGLLYWTLMDEFAEIRVYTENYSHTSWAVMGTSRQDVSDLLNTLKQEKFYKLELERRKDIDAKKEQEAELSERVEGSLNEVEAKTENSTFTCEICSATLDSGLELLRHYAKSHLANKMKDKFSHLTDKQMCKLCKESFDDDSELFGHIGADHLKINLIMKENGLNPVIIEEKDAKSSQASSLVSTNDDLKKSEPDDNALEALEKKLEEVKKQMSDSCDENLLVHSMAEFKDLAECRSDSEEDVKVGNKAEKKIPRGRKKKRGRPKKKEAEETPLLRRSTRCKSGSDVQPSKVVDVTKESNLRERKEARPSCHKCGQWELTSNNRVYPCRQCRQGWHQKCVVPPLSRRPASDWQCPVCDHVELVTSLSNTLAELDVLFEKVEEKRLAEMEVNHSTEVEDEEDDDAEESVEIKTKEDEGPSRELIKYLPNYYESSDEDDSQPACACGGAPGSGSCAWCKKLRGCTCEGQGTCRLCEREAESEVSDDEVEIIEDRADKKAELSTTELFLLTGKVTRRPSQDEAPQPVPVARGRGRGRGRGMSVHSHSDNAVLNHQPPRLPRPRLMSPAQFYPGGIRPIVRQPRPMLQAGGGARQRAPPPRPRGQVRMLQRGHSGVIGGAGPGQRMHRPRGMGPRILGANPRGLRPQGQPTLRPARPPPGLRGPRPNIIGQMRQQRQPPQSSLYHQYTAQAQDGGWAGHQGEDSAGQYYQQVCEEADVIDISDEDEGLEDVITNYNLPAGIQIQRQRVVQENTQEVLSKYNLPAGINIQRL